MLTSFINLIIALWSVDVQINRRHHNENFHKKATSNTQKCNMALYICTTTLTIKKIYVSYSINLCLIFFFVQVTRAMKYRMLEPNNNLRSSE